MKTITSISSKQKIFIIASIFAILCIAISGTSHTAAAAQHQESTCCTKMTHNSIMAIQMSHPTFAWGEEEAQQAMSIGWGCPLEAPIQTIRAGFGAQLLGYVNYFIPLGEMAGILTGWLLAIAAYYLASIVLRWAKAIS